MPKVAPDDLKAFGRAVKRARSLKTWTLDELGAAIEPPVGKSLISKVEKGRKEALSSRTVGRFIKALEMDEAWIDKFLDSDDTEESGETKAERDADQVVDRLRREGATEGASDDLLIQLANRYTEGDHKDRETAYISVRSTLEKIADSDRTAALAGNADAQYATLMHQVDALNAEGEFEEAARILDDQNVRMERLTEIHLKKQLSQDRLRNDPKTAAERLTKETYRQAPPGGVFWKLNELSREWTEKANATGDLFRLKVCLHLAKANYKDRGKGKRELEAAALIALGWANFRLAERSSNEKHLFVAKNAFEGASKKISRKKDPVNWAACRDGLGSSLKVLGERFGDAQLLESSVKAHRATLIVDLGGNLLLLGHFWNNLGIALSELGKITGSSGSLFEAEDALATSLNMKNDQSDTLDWAMTKNNLGIAQRRLGELEKSPEKLLEARSTFWACETLDIYGGAPFIWALLQWNIADLALATHRISPNYALLEEARDRIGKAREFFIEGSDYQTQRCDELLAEVNAAAAA